MCPPYEVFWFVLQSPEGNGFSKNSFENGDVCDKDGVSFHVQKISM